MVSRLLSLTILALSCLTGQPVRLDKSFPDSSRSRLQKTAQDTLAIAEDLFHARPPLPIICHVTNSVPISSLDNYSFPTRILVGINVKDRKYDQFAFQLSHELGHVMLGLHRTNGLVETLCTALSYEVLGRMAAKWNTDPPFPSAKQYSRHFVEYREREQGERLAALDDEIRQMVADQEWSGLSRYLRGHESQTDNRKPNARNMQALAAIVLLSGPVGWDRLSDLTDCTEPSPQERPNLLILPILPRCITGLESMFCRIGQYCSN